uniref:Uncharacterized protein n=1 Tax=Bionectria ochroleuca TaxID=29856 RepID=A0A8H7NA08_BIOOC
MLPDGSVICLQKGDGGDTRRPLLLGAISMCFQGSCLSNRTALRSTLDGGPNTAMVVLTQNRNAIHRLLAGQSLVFAMLATRDPHASRYGLAHYVGMSRSKFASPTAPRNIPITQAHD